jgi:hypothetical protein
MIGEWLGYPQEYFCRRLVNDIRIGRERVPNDQILTGRRICPIGENISIRGEVNEDKGRMWIIRVECEPEQPLFAWRGYQVRKVKKRGSQQSASIKNPNGPRLFDDKNPVIPGMRDKHWP